MSQAKKVNYGYSRTVELPYEQAVERITATLKEQGFGILTEIDVKATLKKKIDKDFTKYVILGACNPGFAFQAPSGEIDIGLLLPCNVTVYENPADGKKQVGKIGWFDRWFSSPSNHRVHHAVNDRYIDRNYGGITMLWDRLFGTFVEEDEKCVYGTRAPLDSWDPLWANVEVYADLARRSWRAARWRDKLAVWVMPPGWQPAAAGGQSWHKPSFDVNRLRRY